jgi:DNA-binding CsgD family transcriptional regulator
MPADRGVAMTAVELRERFGSRLLAARRVATRPDDLTVPVRPDELRLRAEGGPSYRLLGATRSETRAAIAALATQVRVCAINLGHRVSLEGLLHTRPIDQRLAADGVDIRSVYDRDGIPLEVRAAWTEAERAQTREGYVMQRMIVFDRVGVMMDGPPVTTGAHVSTWLVTDPEIVGLAAGLWEASWRLAQPVAPPPAPAPAELTLRQRALIPLLLQGRSEARIARDLGIAPRTVTYEVRALMTALGATCRVDLGYRIRQAEELDAGGLTAS